jgi:hypothetical protein
MSGLEKTQVLLKKPAGRLNAGFFTGFSGKTGFLKLAFSLKMSIFGALKSMQHNLNLLESLISRV